MGLRRWDHAARDRMKMAGDCSTSLKLATSTYRNAERKMTKADTLLELSYERLRDQSNTLNLLTTKASIILGAVGLVVVTGAPDLVQESASWIPFLSLALLFCMYGCAAICVHYMIRAFRTRDYKAGASLRKAYQILPRYKHEGIKMWVADRTMEACEYNTQNLEDIASAVGTGMKYLVAVLFFHGAIKLVEYVCFICPS